MADPVKQHISLHFTVYVTITFQSVILLSNLCWEGLSNNGVNNRSNSINSQRGRVPVDLLTSCCLCEVITGSLDYTDNKQQAISCIFVCSALHCFPCITHLLLGQSRAHTLMNPSLAPLAWLWLMPLSNLMPPSLHNNNTNNNWFNFYNVVVISTVNVLPTEFLLIHQSLKGAVQILLY